MSVNRKKLIAVFGATGQQGGAIVRALHDRGEFRVRALTRNPSKYTGVADEVVAADLTRPETLPAALKGAYGVFAVTNSWEAASADEVTQATAAVETAKDAGVQHFVWSTLPNVEAISGGKFDVSHFTNKAKVDAVVKAAGFQYHSFVVAPFYYQNLLGLLAPQQHPNGSLGWVLPIDPAARGVHAGDIMELGRLVAGALSNPEEAGGGQYLPLVGDTLSFGDITSKLNEQGHAYTFTQVPLEVFATFFPGAAELGEMFKYFEEYTYLGSPSTDRIAAANKIAGAPPTDFATWARSNMPVKAPQTAASGDLVRQ